MGVSILHSKKVCGANENRTDATVRTYQKLSNGHVQSIKIRGISTLFQLQLYLIYIGVRNQCLKLQARYFNFSSIYVTLW